MDYQRILITGGAGFVGSNLALRLKETYPKTEVIALDNLKRRGSELNLPRLKEAGVTFRHGDIRSSEDLEFSEPISLIIDCSAEPSVLAGVNESPEYLINTNLLGTIKCLEVARKHKAHFVFLSTSRIYPIEEISQLAYTEEETRFSLNNTQTVPGASGEGISEEFPLGKIRSLYGATKLSAEAFVNEYAAAYDIPTIINRCGVITGPWQMGKVDQGVIVLWMARHIFGGKLSYIGYGGSGKQVRDFMHIDDLFEALRLQLRDFTTYRGETYNIGGGLKNSLSLQEMTLLCQKISGNTISITSEKNNRPNDIPLYITDSTKFKKVSGWECQKNAEKTFQEIHDWITQNQASLKPILT